PHPGSDILPRLSMASGRAPGVSPLAEEVISLFDQTRAPLLRYLLGFGLPVADGEEILQEVFLALIQHLERGKPRHNLRSWLFRVAHNLALKKRQKSRRDFQTLSDCEIPPENLVVDPAPNPETQLAMHRRNEQVQAVFNALPEQDRRCLTLRAEGLRY